MLKDQRSEKMQQVNKLIQLKNIQSHLPEEVNLNKLRKLKNI